MQDVRPETAVLAADSATVVAEAFENLANGPTWIVGENLRQAMTYVSSLSRAEAVQLMIQASAATMQSRTPRT